MKFDEIVKVITLDELTPSQLLTVVLASLTSLFNKMSSDDKPLIRYLMEAIDRLQDRYLEHLSKLN
jgi:hypothetical protein